jgi:hypothetical protein
MKTIYEQTGWKGALPVTICQDNNVLVRVSEYDFDLGNKAFLTYLNARGVAHRAGEKERFAFTANHAATKAEFFTIFALAKPYEGKQYAYTASEMEWHWRIMLAAKGAMQDCWEIFTGRR